MVTAAPATGILVTESRTCPSTLQFAGDVGQAGVCCCAASGTERKSTRRIRTEMLLCTTPHYRPPGAPRLPRGPRCLPVLGKPAAGPPAPRNIRNSRWRFRRRNRMPHHSGRFPHSWDMPFGLPSSIRKMAKPAGGRHSGRELRGSVTAFAGSVRPHRAARSPSSSACFRAGPQRYPPVSPVPRITRWQGIARATRLAAQARATARTAEGLPIPAATSP